MIPKILAAATISLITLIGCQDIEKNQAKLISKYVGAEGENVTEFLFWKDSTYKHRQIDIIYQNGVHVRVIDVGNDGKIDNVYIPENPNNVKIVRDVLPNQEIMVLPNKQYFKKYVSDSD